MNGRNCPPFVTSLDPEIEIIFDDRIMQIRDSFFAEFISTGKFDGSFGYSLQAFLEISACTHNLARLASSQEEGHAKTLTKSLETLILPEAYSIVEELAHFSAHALSE